MATDGEINPDCSHTTSVFGHNHGHSHQVNFYFLDFINDLSLSSFYFAFRKKYAYYKVRVCLMAGVYFAIIMIIHAKYFIIS